MPPLGEVREGPKRPSALFFHTRISTAASPKARVRSSISASSWASRVDGPVLPAVKAVFPASMNSAFHRPIDCSETFSLRAASAIETSPARMLNTIRVFFSGGITGGRPIRHLPDSGADHALITGLPESLKRDTPPSPQNTAATSTHAWPDD